MPPPELYIWVNGWDEFQSFQTKRGKPWAPPWIKLYPQLLDDPAFLDLTPETRSLLLGVWMLFGRTRGTLTKDTRRLSKQLHQRVTERQLISLNHAGFVDFCSGTVLERRRSSFWNRSILEVDLDVEEKKASAVSGTRNAAREETPERQQQDLNKEEQQASYIPKEAVDDLVTATTNGLGQGFAQKVPATHDDDIPF